MKILFVSAYFPPEIGAPAKRVYELAQRWAAQGHSVQVLTGFPNHPTGVIPPAYRKKLWKLTVREAVDGIEVIRCWLCPTPNRKAWERILNYGSFCLSAVLRGLLLKKPDVVLATSPHLLTGLSGYLLSRAFQVPFVLEIRDLWPESLVASGVRQKESPLIRWIGKLAGLLYQKANRIVTVTEAIASVLRDKWGVPEAKLCVIEHGVDGNRFKPMPSAAWPAELKELSNHPVISYVGTLGQAHGLTHLLQAAGWVLEEDPKIKFLLIGEGAEKQSLMQEAQGRNLSNVRFLSQQPWEEIPIWLNRSTVCVTCLKPEEAFQTVMPSKILEYLACEKPVILAGLGHAAKVLESSGAGLAVPPSDTRALAKAILKLAHDPSLRQQMGKQGRLYVLERFGADKQAAAYLKLLRQICPS